MSNMSYCRFQNTLSDLQDCYNWMQSNPDAVVEALAGVKSPDDDDYERLSPEESDALSALVELCNTITGECDPDA